MHILRKAIWVPVFLGCAIATGICVGFLLSGYPRIVQTSAPVKSVVVEGGVAYLACGSGGLATIDLTDPAKPGTPVYRSIEGSANDVLVVNGYAYVASSTGGLAISDISNPSNPGVATYQPVNGIASNLAILGNYTYIIAGNLSIFNVTYPANPVLVNGSTGIVATDVAVNGSFVYVVSATSLDIYNATDPVNLKSVFHSSVERVYSRVFVVRSSVYLLGNDFTIARADFTGYFQSAGFGTASLGENALAVSGSYTYFVSARGIYAERATGYGGVVLGAYSSPGVDIAVVESHAYVAASNGLAIVTLDLTNMEAIPQNYQWRIVYLILFSTLGGISFILAMYAIIRDRRASRDALHKSRGKKFSEYGTR